MGFWGGFGKGMMSFSQTLGDQRKLDWEAQQSQLKHERAVNLENLRADRADTRQESQNAFTLERDEARAAARKQEIEEGRTYADKIREQEKLEAKGEKSSQYVTKDGRIVSNEMYEGMDEAERAELLSEKDYAIGLAREKALAIGQVKRDISKEDALTAANSYRAFFGENITPAEETIASAIEHQIDTSMLTGKDGKPPSGEQMKQANELLSQDATFNDPNTTTEVRVKMLADTLGSLGIGTKKPGLLQGAGEQKVVYNKETDLERLIDMTPEARAQHMDVLKAKAPEVWEEVNSDLNAATSGKGTKKKTKESGEKPGLLVGPAVGKSWDSLKQFASRNVGGDPVKEYMKNHPNATKMAAKLAVKAGRK